MLVKRIVYGFHKDVFVVFMILFPLDVLIYFNNGIEIHIDIVRLKLLKVIEGNGI